jgi:hypothetical protein
MVGALVPRSIHVNRILKPMVFLLAAIYFVVDAIFMTVARPLSNWVARALGIRKASCMDSFIAALPHTFFVCGTAGCS